MNTSYQTHINIHVCVGFLPARGSMVISLKERSGEPSSGLPASQHPVLTGMSCLFCASGQEEIVTHILYLTL